MYKSVSQDASLFLFYLIKILLFLKNTLQLVEISFIWSIQFSISSFNLLLNPFNIILLHVKFGSSNPHTLSSHFLLWKILGSLTIGSGLLPLDSLFLLFSKLWIYRFSPSTLHKLSCYSFILWYSKPTICGLFQSIKLFTIFNIVNS